MWASIEHVIYLLMVHLTCDFTDGALVRLVGGKTPNRGRVEVYYDYVWGTVCDDGWDDLDATTVCRMLGYSSGKAYGSAYFGEGRGRIWLDNLQCYSYSTSVWNCDGNSWGSHDCQHHEDAGAWCAGSVYGLALLPGIKPNIGTLLVSYYNEWGTVCDDSFDNKDADVACRELGYRSGGVAYTEKSLGEGSGTIWMDNLGCTGTESKLSSCSHNGWGINNCGHSEDAGVYCYRGQWSSWSYCNATCGGGYRTRRISCSGADSSTYCRSRTVSVSCNTHSCPVNGVWGSWFSLGSCSVTCGIGTRIRSRSCNNPAPAHGGRSCSGMTVSSTSCDSGVKCPVNGVWGSWNSWGLCSVTCSTGTRTRSRICNNPAPAHGGRSCSGMSMSSTSCDSRVKCPVNGMWSVWSVWGSCSVTCSTGIRTRSRRCDNPAPVYGGQSCFGMSVRSKHCDSGVKCPVDGEWSSWEMWSSCSVTCANGTRSRERACSNPMPAYGGSNCVGYKNETEMCLTKKFCPVDGQWASWMSWSSCSVTCESGSRTRTRECSDPNPAHSGQNCTGSEEETESCLTHAHCPVDGRWATWDAWSSCSVTCENGTRTRHRACSEPVPAYGGQNCTGDGGETDQCATGVHCPVDGMWAAWNSWLPCSVTCENGSRSRVRECSDPAPAYGGQTCAGDGQEMDSCVTGITCPVDGQWAPWEPWSSCSATCENGSRKRVRTCSNPIPAHGGQNCIGDSEKSKYCITGKLCPVDGQWALWETWSSCSVTCENGTRSRVRECSDPAPAYGGQTCSGNGQEVDSCVAGIQCPVDGQWASWEPWSSCSVSCENGTRTRVRNCTDPVPTHGGQNCIGDEEERDQCVIDLPCPVDGHWGFWETWTSCSVTCENGMRTRVRLCSDPVPANDGQNCTGNAEESELCKTGIPCPVNGMWSSWESWSKCSATCGNGTRSRVCGKPAPIHGGIDCDGDSEDVQTCFTDTACPVYGQWGNWLEWSACSVTCDCGYQHRSRVCKHTVVQDSEIFCNGSSNSTKMCNTNILCPGACGEGNMMCFDKRTCIANEMSCDGYEDCPSGEDERNCLEQRLFYSVPLTVYSSGPNHRYQSLHHILFLQILLYAY